MKLIFASHNKGKIIEMHKIMAPLAILSAEEVGVFTDVVEDGTTFAENALKKAKWLVEKTGEWAFGDDSGLCIEALHGLPGVHSKRWSGENKSDERLVDFTLDKMKEFTDRRAFFQTDVALVAPDGREWFFSGQVKGVITAAPRGLIRDHLPYDVIFQPNGYNQTFAEMSHEEKNFLSHRGLAFTQLKKFLMESKLFNI
ncbi:MAG: non-canonical purine NTP pyrophosphatase, RdgB/HAM1 family [Candidatus Komeilibacteria bacterium CG_4_10_14_0_2_um_filter_37_10]|uniref:dITP/XTP pyrophosphatase n=1 Tax=Candidatus Komeilibacteria bacterium CG_4_10_14_0_2_um_filter_37_10 TaxID=1974470 RepID=A0A2M7VG43_9BACT|nr:MAG: non-canonical purine NTP pyrophosphatase, RdgB/HAM1 family [Candidatus Komeilibacteria bacterium CG_4_10_14_0_2_um_filter_37_10]PJA92493.1 MAG: non-canonical purine NTP pyrophosphatase, RdgB/HAM1 family [Candidatus Komeilibacteria bacterium CG_4_9_14_3_um_filter_37_5]